MYVSMNLKYLYKKCILTYVLIQMDTFVCTDCIDTYVSMFIHVYIYKYIGFLIGVTCALAPKAGIVLGAANCLEMAFLGTYMNIYIYTCIYFYVCIYIYIYIYIYKD
jgi:hypothetical protein